MNASASLSLAARSPRRIPAPRKAVQVLLRCAAAALRGWLARRRSRDELARLNDRMLRDIGLSRAGVKPIEVHFGAGASAGIASARVLNSASWTS
jgi:uncharacterized protein YjiS (DUF1127 family)